MRRRARGLAIFTALLIVMLLYMTVTALVVQARQNIRLTQETHLRMQGEFLARGAVHTALARLNSDPFWFGAHNRPEAAETISVAGHEARAWIEAAGPPDVYRLRGRAQVGTVSSDYMVSLYRTPLADASVVASSRRDGVFRTNPRDGSSWSTLPTPPRIGWRRGQPIVGSPVPEGPDDLPREAVAGGPDGSLYLGTRVNAKATVLMLAAGSSQWSLLPMFRLSDGQRPLAVRQLAVAGERLYCVAGDNAGELLYLDRPAQAQTRYDPQTGTFTPASGEWVHLSVPQGERVQTVAAAQNELLYVKVEEGCLRLDPSGPTWVRLPRPPARFWARVEDGDYELRSVEQGPAQLEGMTCDPQGNLFLNRQVDGISTLFKFIPSNAAGQGTYRVMPPVRIGEATNDRLSHDYSGILYTRVRKQNAPDQVLYSESANLARPRRFAALPQTPNVSGAVDAIGGAGVYDLSRMRYVPQFSE